MKRDTVKITLDERQLTILAREIASLLRREELPQLVTTQEAADILGITPSRLRQVKDRYPHIKKGAAQQGKLLFDKNKLIQSSYKQ